MSSLLALPMSETYTNAAPSHGPSGIYAWRSATYALVGADGAEIASCRCDVLHASGDIVAKKLAYAGGPSLDVQELRPTARGSGTGHALWPGAIALSLRLHGGGLAGAASVVELGCGGTALPGCYAARALPGARVTLTDGAAELLPAIRAAAARCGAAATVAGHAYGSGAGGFDGVAGAAYAPPAPADLVLGAEIAYRAEDAAALADELPRRLKPGGRAVLCSAALRRPLAAAAALLRSRGLRVSEEVLELRVAADDAPREVHRFRFVTAVRESS